MNLPPAIRKPLIVVKVGGALAATPGALGAVGAALAAAGRRHRLVVVPGGGPFADAVREFDRREPVSPRTPPTGWRSSRWTSTRHVLAERIPGAVLVEEPGPSAAALGAGRRRGAGAVPLAAGGRCAARTAGTPRSDSVAAFVAGALDASRISCWSSPPMAIRPDAGGSVLSARGAGRAAVDGHRLAAARRASRPGGSERGVRLSGRGASRAAPARLRRQVLLRTARPGSGG